jgi:hypothetical protein
MIWRYIVEYRVGYYLLSSRQFWRGSDSHQCSEASNSTPLTIQAALLQQSIIVYTRPFAPSTNPSTPHPTGGVLTAAYRPSSPAPREGGRGKGHSPQGRDYHRCGADHHAETVLQVLCCVLCVVQHIYCPDLTQYPDYPNTRPLTCSSQYSVSRSPEWNTVYLLPPSVFLRNSSHSPPLSSFPPQNPSDILSHPNRHLSHHTCTHPYRAIFEHNHGFLMQTLKGSGMPKLMNIQMELRKCCNHPFLINGVEQNEMVPIAVY